MFPLIICSEQFTEREVQILSPGRYTNKYFQQIKRKSRVAVTAPG